MYSQITTFSCAPDREDDVIAISDSVRDETKVIAGLQSACSVRVAGGKLVVGTPYDTEESTSAALPKIQEILGKLAAVLTALPEVQEGSVIWEL